MRARLLETVVRMGGELATAFIAWAEQVAPPLLQKLGELASKLIAWVVAQVPVLAAQLAQWVNEFADWVQRTLPPMLNQLGDLISNVLDWINEQAPPLLEKLIGEWLPAFILWIVQTIPPLLLKLGELLLAITQWIITTAVPKILEFALKMGEALVEGVIQAAQELGPKLGQAIMDAFHSISLDFGIFHLHGGVLDIDMPMGNKIEVGARAMGGPVSAGSPYLVGEQGPELFVPGASGSIVPNGALGRNGGVTVAFNGPVYGFDDFQAKVTEATLAAARIGHIGSSVLVTG